MGIIKTNDNFEHPEGKIKLLNGTVLDCYPLELQQNKVENDLKLDTTGNYLVVGRRKTASTPQSDKEKEEEKKLFLYNAFRFLQYRDRIMSDSRMFLCPVPIQSGIAYTGKSGFNRPTLGVYLEWWLNCESALICEKDETKKLVYHIAGSPLSGSNHCGVVDENGKTETQSIYPFLSLWPDFMRINSRYDDAKGLYQAYTLEQVVEIMEEEDLSSVDDKEIEILFLKSALRKRQKNSSNQIKQLYEIINKLKFHLFYAHRDALKNIMAIHDEKKEQKEKREKEIDAACKELRKKLKAGEIDNKHYQQQLTPLKKEKEHNDFQLRNYRWDAVKELFPDLNYTLDDVESFFKDPRLTKL